MSASSPLRLGSAQRVDLAVSGDPAGQRIAALRAGPPTGRPVLLVPGYTGSKEDFGPLLDPLADAGFFVTAIDLPGQLDSPSLPRSADYSPDRLGEAVREVARQLGERTLLLGHSFGGLVARAAAIAEPALFDSLVLLCSGPAALNGARRATMDQLDPVLATSGLSAVYAAMQEIYRADPRYVAPPLDVAEFLERRFLRGSVAMLRGMADALRREPDRVAQLAGTGLPVLVAHGADDDAWPAGEQRDMARRLDARYVVIPDSAHSPNVENPDETIHTLLSFWS